MTPPTPKNGPKPPRNRNGSRNRPRAWNSTLPAPSKPLTRKTRIKPRNPRKGSRFPKHVDEPYREWVRSLPCCVCGRHPAHIHPHHVRTRGAGGSDRGNLVPLCPLDHAELHAVGRRTFAARHLLDLAAIAADLATEYPEADHG